MTASLLCNINCLLGEGAFWHETRQSFFWVDIDGKALHEFVLSDGKVDTWNFDHRPSMIAEDDHGHLVIAFQGGLARLDLQTGKLNWLLDIEKKNSNIRTNDGAVDPSGRLWIGTMDAQFKKEAGSLFCVGRDLRIEKKIDSLTIPNGLVWSLDGGTMYHVDSPTRQVKAYQFENQTGAIQFIKTVITVPEDTGTPDGMCIDEEGMLWIAHWNGFGVYRWNPQIGKMIGKIEVPVPQVSSCAFGGENFDQLFITTARENFTPEQLEKYPASGSVYIANPGVKGVRKNIFQG